MALAPSTSVSNSMLTSLPYHVLEGGDFEGLIYDLLTANGSIAQKIRRRGFRQYGVDLQVTTASGELLVYQCKNHRKARSADLDGWFRKFEDDWLRGAHLRRPSQFVICCPGEIDALDWRARADAFQMRSGVVPILWDRDYINSLLKDRPAIVAGFFGDPYARLFCNDWDNGDLCVPIGTIANWRRYTESHRRRIGDAVTRYHRARALQRLVIPLHLQQHVTKIFASPAPYRTIIVRGPAGSGKSVTALALMAQKAIDGFHCHYTSLKWADSLSEIRRAVHRRTSRPTIFLIDDCDQGTDLTDAVYEQVVATVDSKTDIWFVLLKRSVSQAAMWITSELERTLLREEAVLDMRSSIEIFGKIVRRRFDRLFILSDEQIEILWMFTGGDLQLLDAVAESLHSVGDVDSLSLDSILPAVQKNYFADGMERYETVEQIAAVGQFDVTPLVAAFRPPTQSEGKALRLLAGIEGIPNRYIFSHSSVAELAFRTIIARRGGMDNDEIALQHVVNYVSDERIQVSSRADHLVKFLTASRKLPLSSDERFQTGLLGGPAIRFLQSHILEIDSAAVLGTLLVQADGRHAETYAAVINERIRDGTLVRRFPLLTDLGRFLRAIRCSPYRSTAEALRTRVGHAELRSLASSIRPTDFILLVAALHDESRSAAAMLADIGNFAFAGQLHSGFTNAITDIVSVDPAAEDVLIAAADLTEIAAALPLRLRQLLRFFGAVPPAFGAAVMRRLSDDQLDRLVAAECGLGVSTDWLNIVLFALLSSNHAEALRAFYERMGPSRLNAILGATASYVGHLRVIHRMPHDLRVGVVQDMNDDLVDRLVNRTIAIKRLFDTTKFAFRDLRDESPAILSAFHRKIGVTRYLHLLRQCATLYGLELLMIYLPNDMVVQLIAAIDDPFLEALVDNMIERKSGLSALGWTTRSGNPAVRSFLYETVGIPRLARLVGEIGSLADLIMIAGRLPSARRIPFAQAVLARIGGVEALIVRTNSATGTIAKAFEYLANNRPFQAAIESVLGVDEILALLCRIGGFHHVARVISALSDRRRHELLSDTRLMMALRPIKTDEDFATLAVFAREHGSMLPTINPADSPLLLSIPGQMAKATWETMSRVCHTLDEAPESQLRALLNAAMAQRAAAGSSDDLPFSENAHRLGLKVRFGMCSREEVKRLWRSCIPRTDVEMGSVHAITAASEVLELFLRCDITDADTLLKELNQPHLAKSIGASGLWNVSSFLWRLNELARSGGVSAATFSSRLAAAIRIAAQKRAFDRLSRVSMADVYPAVALLGLLSHLLLWERPLAGIDRRKITNALHSVQIRPSLGNLFFVIGSRLLGLDLPAGMPYRLRVAIAAYSHHAKTAAYEALQRACRPLLIR